MCNETLIVIITSFLTSLVMCIIFIPFIVKSLCKKIDNLFEDLLKNNGKSSNSC